MAAQQTARIMPEQQQAAEPSIPAAPLLLNTQYVKEFSFRVPGAPAIYANMPERPHVTLALDVLVRPIPEGQPQPIFEVTLTMRCEATFGPLPPDAPPPAVAYQIELGYAGIFTLADVPQNAIEPVLLAECPRLLFPFARSMLANITREAGFAPLLLQPIDFVALWQTRRQQNAQSQPRQHENQPRQHDDQPRQHDDQPRQHENQPQADMSS